MNCFSGFGTVFKFFVPMSVCVDNFPDPVRGTIVGLTSSFFIVGPIVFGALYATLFSNGPIGNFSLFLAILCGVMNISSMWFVRPIPLRSEGDTKQQVKQVKRHIVSFYDDVNDGDSGTADDWHERLGINLLKVPAFHIFLWCFLLVAPLQATPTCSPTLLPWQSPSATLDCSWLYQFMDLCLHLSQCQQSD